MSGVLPISSFVIFFKVRSFSWKFIHNLENKLWRLENVTDVRSDLIL